MRVICDTGPLVSAADASARDHWLAAAMVNDLGRALLVPDPVVAEADYLLRRRVGSDSARLFLSALDRGEHRLMFLTPGLFRRATEIDAQYVDLNLGFADAAVMACAERHNLPILTFDFRDFRATAPDSGSWRLVVDESTYRKATSR